MRVSGGARATGCAGLLTLVLAGTAMGQVSPEICGPLHTPPAAAPWDYRRDKHFHALVEDAHFTPQIENLIRGRTARKPGPDIDYTLGRFPNHPRALIAVTKLGQRFPDTKAELLPRPVECYFERAIRFAPDDLVVRMLYARFLQGVNRLPEALKQMDHVNDNAEGNPLTHRSLGLLYLEFGEFDRALQQAWRFETLVPGPSALREALVKQGRWRDPTPADAAEANPVKPPPAAASAASAAP